MKEFQLTVDPHTLDGRKELWTLDFRHHAYVPNVVDYNNYEESRRERIGISLYAHKEGKIPAFNQDILVGEMSFSVGKTPQQIMITSHPDAEDIVEALVAQGYARWKGDVIERHQDYPGADEIEEFRFKRLDVTDFYGRYLHQRGLDVMQSPVTHIRLCEGQISNGRNPQDYITCRIGGIEQERGWVGSDGRKMMRVASLYSECRYQLYELAMKSHAKQLALYKEAGQRSTDHSIRFNKGMHFFRCKIDGEQQLSKVLGILDICDYQRNKDIHALTAKYFADELNPDNRLSQDKSSGMKR